MLGSEAVDLGPQPAAGPVLAIDHDRLFKELLTTFFVEFLELFFPKLAAALDRNSIEFLSQEHFVNLTDGEAYLADIVVKARFTASEAFFLIHVEHQSTAPTGFARRFFRYYSAIFEKHGLPVYPIVVYSHDSPKKAQPSVYRVDFPDGAVLRFHYRVVQLNRLSWRRFVNAPNPVASALMAKMKVAERDRPRVKAECLRLMVTLKLDRARMRLIAAFVDTYLYLNEAEEERFNRSLAAAKLMPEERKEVVEVVTSWERKGIEKGRAEGRSEGRAEGRSEGRAEGRTEGRAEGRNEGRAEGILALRAVLLEILSARFGAAAAESIAGRLAQVDSIDEMRDLTHRTLTANSLSDLGL